VVLLLVTPLDARLLQQLAVLLLGHALAALLDDGTHGEPSFDGGARTDLPARAGELDPRDPVGTLPGGQAGDRTGKINVTNGALSDVMTSHQP
jgi:hypothetical protein